jgi:hypothetical protein
MVKKEICAPEVKKEVRKGFQYLRSTPMTRP